jgi:hypothetical protein
MIVRVQGKNIRLNDKDVAIAKSLVNNYIACMKVGTAKANKPEMFFTLLIALHNKTTELLTAFGAEALAMLMDITSKKGIKGEPGERISATIQNMEWIIPEGMDNLNTDAYKTQTHA